MCKWVLRTFETKEALPMVTLFTSIIRPKVEYGCQIWSPTKRQEMVEIEMVQRQFIKRKEGIKDLTYPEQFKKLKLYLLERRREIYLIIYLRKVMEGLVPVCVALKSRNRGRNGRSIKLPLLSRNASARVKTLREGSFFILSVKIFNVLPRSIKDLSGCSMEKFKRQLDKFLMELPDAQLIPGYIATSPAGGGEIVLLTGAIR